MASEEAPGRSPLDKPLKDLTEEDISQLTREDCRKFLKQKGMRRPSWNKSQAIQQVISLKMLLETPLEPDNPANTASPQSHSPPPVRISPTADSQIPASDGGKEVTVLAFSGDASGDVPANSCVSPRTTPKEATPVGQMTIFYCGKVNVYERVSPEKARTVMLLAGSRIYSPYDVPVEVSPVVRPPMCQQAVDCISGEQSCPSFAHAVSPTSHSGKVPQMCRDITKEQKISRENESEEVGPTSRKASLQRYLEKRKDRFKGKRKHGGLSCSSMEVRSQEPGKHSSWTGTCGMTPPMPSHMPMHCSSLEKQVKKSFSLTVDLNDDDIQET